jgi:peptide/nickel transport system substrate-binding protein
MDRTTPPIARAPGSPLRGLRPRGRSLAATALAASLAIAALAPATIAQDAEPQHGGTLIFARNQDVQNLNPVDAPDNGSIFIIMQIFDQLVEVGAAPDPQPGLAESWTSSEDGLTWTFSLREAMFSNGDPVTAEDVKFSLDRWKDPEVNYAYAGLTTAVDTVTVIDDRTVEVTLSRPDGAFLDNLAMFVASIVPKAVVEELGEEGFGANPVGSGPFQLVSWARGERLELERNPHYWRAPMPYLDGLVIDFVQDDNTRLLRVENGEAHLGEDVPYAQIERLEAVEGVSVVAEEVFKWDAIWFNTLVPPLDDLNVRLALNYATPKEDILETVLHGRGDIANHVIARVKYLDESVPAYPYDMDMARELMAESSAPDGFDLTMIIPAGDSTELAMAQVIQAAWGELGVNVTLEPADLGTAFGTWLGEDPTAAMSATFPGSALSSDTLSDDNLLFVFLVPDTGLRSFGTNLDDAEIVRLIREGNATFDEDVRAGNFAEAQALAMAAAPAVPLFFTNARTAVRDEVQGFHTFSMGWWPLWEVWLSE